MHDTDDECSTSDFEAFFEIRNDLFVYPLIGSLESPFFEDDRSAKWPMVGLSKSERNLIRDDIRKIHLVTVKRLIEQVWRDGVVIDRDEVNIGSVNGEDINRTGVVFKKAKIKGTKK